MPRWRSRRPPGGVARAGEIGGGRGKLARNRLRHKFNGLSIDREARYVGGGRGATEMSAPCGGVSRVWRRRMGLVLERKRVVEREGD